MRRPNTTDNKYKEGTIVYAIKNPGVKLLIRRYVNKIYYCKVYDDPDRKELVYFGSKLTDAAPPIN